MRRWLFNIAAAASLLLCVAVCGLWQATWSRPASTELDGVRCAPLDKMYGFSSFRSRIVINWVEINNPGDPPADVSTDYLGVPDWRWFAFTLAPGGNAPSGRPWARHGTLVFPHWAAALATVVLPGWWLADARRRRLARLKGACRQCGYDLRASPDRCPECGAEVAPSAA